MSAADVLRRHGMLAAILAVLAASFLLDPAAVASGPVLCPLRGLTGLPCPSCGLTRSFVASAHGQLGAAFTFHLFGPFLFLACAAFVLLAVARLLVGRALPASTWLRAATGPLLCTWFAWALCRISTL